MNHASTTAGRGHPVAAPPSRSTRGRAAHAAGRRHREGHRPRALHRRPAARRGARRPDPAQPDRARRHPRHRYRQGAARCPACAPSSPAQDFAAPYGVIPIAQNEWPLARDKVRYRGEPLAAVAAVDEATAEAALRAIVLDIEPLPAYFSAADARAADAVPLHDNKPGNVEREVEQDFGDVDAGLRRRRPGARADVSLRRGRARPDRAQRHGRRIRARARPPDRALGDAGAVLPAPDAGAVPRHGRARASAWSSRSSAAASATASSRSTSRWSPRALARAAGGTVKPELTREEGFLTHRGRPETDIRLKLGMKKIGRDHRRRLRDRPARRRVRRLRPGDDPLRRRAAARALPASARAAIAAIASTPTRRRAARCAATARSTCATRSSRCSTAWPRELGLDPFAVRRANLIVAAVPHAQRPAGQLLRPARTASTGSRRPRAGRRGTASCRAGAASAWPARTTSRARPSRCTGAASRTR